VNRAVTEEEFTYRRCTRCQALFLENPPEDAVRYYPEAYYGLDRLDETRPTELAKLALVRRHVRAGRLVEIGPGAGGFAREALRAGFEVTGLEMDPGACRHLREAIGAESIQTDDPAHALDELEPADVICAWHVIEHLSDPWSLVRAAGRRLAPGGVLVVATPNPGALQLRLLGKRWNHLDAPRHQFLIPADALAAEGRAAGLSLEEVVWADRTANDWNAFGWAQRLSFTGRMAPKAGAALALLLAPLERTGRRGTTYTAVFRQNRGS
jgi:SAM-dependent methyltransferase